MRAQPTQPAAAPATAVAAAAAATLDQCARCIESLPAGAYARESRVLAGGTIGKHVRHVADHYRAILDQASTDQAGAERDGAPIDYDRPRP